MWEYKKMIHDTSEGRDYVNFKWNLKNDYNRNWCTKSKILIQHMITIC